MSLPGLSDAARVTLEEAKTAIREFMEPDEYSSTPDFEGRRIAIVTGGWRILNYELYRDKLSAEDKRRNAAERQLRYKARLRRESVTALPILSPGDAPVTLDDKGDAQSQKMPKMTFSDADAEAEAEADAEQSAPSVPPAAEQPPRTPAERLPARMPDPNLTESEPGYWAERMYDRHPKKRDRVMVFGAISKIWEARRFGWEQQDFDLPLFLRSIDEIHARWCESEDWRKDGGRFAPVLARWLEDQGWKAEPPTKAQQPKSWEVMFDKVMKEKGIA